MAEDAQLIGGVEKREINMVDYDEQWLALYEVDRQRIHPFVSSFPPPVHHVGSTSVPGLCAEWSGGYVEKEPDFTMVAASVLILNGERDLDGGDSALLVEQIPGARRERVDADYVSTMDHPDFVKRSLEFLSE